ncbi:outer membrane beta-barrel protein [Rhodobacterales bacterium HKCCSP123]|nr:outer membrane beta-barrel protein [Rhodobacterales bacterium HKCCSP123]
MRHLTIAVMVVTASSLASFAGPLDAPPAEPPVVVDAHVPPSPTSFDGFYGGLSFAGVRASGDYELFQECVSQCGPGITGSYDFDHGHGFGGFLGYNHQQGNVVFGGEGRLLSFSDIGDEFLSIESVVDISARIGLPLGDALLFGGGGVSFANYDALGISGSMSGYHLRAGIEYNITDRWFVGGDFTMRQFDDVEIEYPSATETSSIDINSVSLRAGIRF